MYLFALNREVKDQMDPKKLDELAEKIAKIIPPGFQELQSEIKKDIKAIMQSALTKLDLVSREEFDVQTKVLLRLKKQISDLEKQLDAIDKQVNKKTKAATKTSTTKRTSKK